MLIYKDIISGDEMISDSFDLTEIHDGFFYEAPGKWVVTRDVEVDIGANASAEGEDAEDLESTAKKVVDIVDTFRLVEQSGFDKKGLLTYFKGYLAAVLEKLPADKQDEFKAKSQPAVKAVLAKINDLQFFTGESMNLEGTMAFAFYPEGAAEPTFWFPKYSLKAVKC